MEYVWLGVALLMCAIGLALHGKLSEMPPAEERQRVVTERDMELVIAALDKPRPKPAPVSKPAPAVDAKKLDDLTSALVNLGYLKRVAEKTAQAAIASAPREELAGLIKLALSLKKGE